MAFNMTIAGSGQADHISHEEEEFLMLIDRHGLNCPVLQDVWNQFYDGPRIYPGRARAIVSELDIIDQFIREVRPEEMNVRDWGQTHQRLRAFFLRAEELESVIECSSD